MGTPCVACGSLKNLTKEIGILGFGLLFLLGSGVISVLTLPLVFFRFLLSYIAKYVRPDLAEMVGSTGNIFSSDLLSEKSPRCTIIVSFMLEGHWTEEEASKVYTRMVTMKDETTGKLIYPEVRQFVTKWLGFAFWKDDPSFTLENHLLFYKPEDPSKPVNDEEVSRVTEKLLNKRFAERRSPWEIHIINNYESLEFPHGAKTLALMRVHHTMADGYSILFSLVTGVLQAPLKSLLLPSPNYYRRKGWNQLWNSLTFPLRVWYDVSHYFIKGLRKSPLNIPDGRKHWKQIYGKSRAVPIEKIKEIKTQLNVSFTSVLLAAVSASLSRVIRAKCKKEMRKNEQLADIEAVERAAFFIPLPLPGHPNAFKNHVTGAQIDLPLEKYADPRNRVYECERLLQEQKKSTIPWLLIFLARTIGLLPSALCGEVSANRVNIAGLTSFPAGNSEIRLGHGKGKLLAVEAACGALTGISGAAIMAISYQEQIRFAVTAETAALSRQEVEAMLMLLTDEINLLYDILKTENELSEMAPSY